MTPCTRPTVPRRFLAIGSLLGILALLLLPPSAQAEPSPSPEPSSSSSSSSSSPSSAESSAEPTTATAPGSPSVDAATPSPTPASTPTGGPTASPDPTPSALPEEKAGDVGVQAVVATSGVLRDARTGAPIPNSCVGFRTADATSANYTNTREDGSWEIFTDDLNGPLNLAFYVVANGNDPNPCQGPVVSTDYQPSWYESQPFTGTDPVNAEPPAAAIEVAPGTSGIVACLAPDRLPTACAAPTTTISGRVVGAGPVPISQACIFALGEQGFLGGAITTTDGRWTISNLPIDLPFVVGVVPPFDVGEGPCSSEGRPPAPRPGDLQPEFYRNTWVDLTDERLEDDAYGWATDHGAATISNSRSDIDVCLTTDAGSVVPRPSCDPSPTPTPTPSSQPTTTQAPTVAPAADNNSSGDSGGDLADTGAPVGWPAALALVLLALGGAVLSRRAQ